MALDPDGGAAPYAPPSAVLGIIDAFRDRGLQTPFSADILVRAGVTEALANRTLSALQILGFIDDMGNPTEVLKALRVAPSDEFNDRLAAQVRDAYAPVFAFADPAQDSPDRIRDAFRVYSPVGQQSRMVTLFMGMCERAGIVEAGTKRQSSGPSTPRQRATTPARQQRQAATGKRNEIAHGVGGGKTPAPIVALVHALPDSWTERERDLWVAALVGTLNFAIPIKEPTVVETDDAE